MKKRIALLLLIPIFLQLMSLFVFHFRERFHPREFEHGFSEVVSEQVSGLDYTQLDPIFAQPFHYLGHGKQMIALESQDGQYVLKLFNPMRPLKKGWYLRWRYWKRYNSLKWIKREWFSKKARLQKLFKRHRIAYEHLKNETGLVFVHLQKDPRICHRVHITDQKGKFHVLALEDTPFVLQKKAVLVPQYLQSLIHTGQVDEAKQAVEKLEALFSRRIDVGITDRIQTMENNYGFADGEPIQIDVGRIWQHSILEQGERERVIENLHQWLSNHFPLLSSSAPTET